MARPKYNIGDAFLVERKFTHDGCDFNGVFNYYVVVVSAESTDNGVNYKYGMSRNFPAAYCSATISLWLYETSLDKTKQIEGYFG